MNILFPIALLAGGVYALSQEDAKKTNGVVGPQPAFTPGSVDVFTEMRPLPDGSGAARYFKPDVAQAILSGFLARQGIQPVTVQGAGPQLGLWKLVPFQPGGISARDTAAAAQHSGLAVLGSLSMVLAADASVDKLLFTTPDPNKGIATQQSQWAILLDGIGAVTSTARTPTAPSAAAPPPAPQVPATPPTVETPAVQRPTKVNSNVQHVSVQGTAPNGVSAHEAAATFLDDPGVEPPAAAS